MNDPERIRLGFIGAGGICEQRHRLNLAKMSDVELVAVCNRSPESSRRVQEKWGIARMAANWREILDFSRESRLVSLADDPSKPRGNAF